MDTLSDESAEAVALLHLLRLPGVGDRTTLELVERFGSGRAAHSASRAAFSETASAEAADARGDTGIERRVRRGLAWCRRQGIAVRVRGFPGYPERLNHLSDPPSVVLLKGDEGLLDRPAVAVVGSRRSTAGGRRAAAGIAGELAARGVVVVSGLALGIDAAAHRAALDAGGPTAAVLGTGLDTPHPPSNRDLFARIGREGLLVTEFLPGEPARAHHFPRRNRILAALSLVVVVVEAAERSGALITAGHAADLGRPVAAVPGSIHTPGHAGANRLLRDGAHVVIEPEDVIGLLPDPVQLSLLPALLPEDPDQTPAQLEPGGDAALLWRALRDSGAGNVDDLAAAAGLPASRAAAAMSLLEMEGLAERDGGTRFRGARRGR